MPPRFFPPPGQPNHPTFPWAAYLQSKMTALQPITRNLPAFVRDPLVALIGQECYTTLVWNTDFADAHCLKYSLSKGLGVAMVAGGAILKLPQIITVVRSGSARGLSLSSYVLDTAATAITVAYNIRNAFPFSTYGEMLFLLVQNAILIVLITGYSPRPTIPRLVPIVALFASLGYALSSTSLVPQSTLSFLQTLTIPLSVSSKLPQIISNFRLGSTGQLSAFLVFNSLAGCIARVFTTRTETNDPVLFWGFLLSAVANGIIALQILLYWNKTAVEVVEKRADGLVKPVAVVSSVDKRDLPPVIASGEKNALATPVKGTLPKRTASPASAGSARRYVRKLE
ncbi:hypothetical protein JCM8097_001904 [Rhodosporidiobolus ruineniae]